jgi:EmrB/QacA subfamily drug resistance transporter
MNDAKTKKYALIIATMTGFLTPFMASAVNIALPTIAQEFSMDAVLLSWVATAYLLAAAIFLVSIGRIADIYGRKKIFSIGVFIYTLSAILSAFSPSGEWLVVFRFIEGFGAAMIFGTGVAILSSVFPPGERGKVFGINVAAVYFGLSVGPFLGGLLTQTFGWRSVFLSNVPVGISILVVVYFGFKGKEWKEAEGEKFDYTGSIIYTLMLIALMYGLSLLPEASGILLLVAGFVGLIVFVRVELSVEHPVLDVTLFRTNRVFAFSNMAALINYSATFAVGFLLSLYLQFIKNFSPLNAGLILLAQPIIQAVFSPLAGKLSDRIEPRIVASSGMSLIVVGLSIFAIIIGETTALEYIVISLCILGLGFALFSSPNTNAIMSSVEKRCYGIASGMVGTMRLIGQVTSLTIVMLLFSLFIGRIQIVPETYPLFLISVRVAFILFVILYVIGVFASLVRGKLRDEELAECKLPGN